MHRLLTALLVALVCLAGRSADAAIYYVSTTGSAGGIGSVGSPWDLRTALAGASGVIVAGDLVYVRGGTYTGHFKTAGGLTGSSGSPVTFRGYPGERAILDGNFTTTNTGTIASGSGGDVVTIALATTVDLLVGDTLRVGGEVFEALTVGVGTITAIRGWQSTCSSCGSHSAGETVWTTKPILETESANPYITFQDFEITDSGTDRPTFDQSSVINYNYMRRRAGVSVFGTGTRIIDCVIHDVFEGIEAWEQAAGATFSGVVIYNVGVMGLDRGHGHGIYTQNQTGTKTYYGVVSANNFGFAWQQYGSSLSHLQHFVWQHVVTFGNHANDASPPYNLGALWGGDADMSDITIDHGSFYLLDPQIGYGSPGNTGITLSNNVVRGRLVLSLSKGVSLSSNTFAAAPASDQYLLGLTLNGTGATSSDFTFTANRYYHANTNFPNNDFFITPDPSGSGCNYYWYNVLAAGYGYCGPSSQSWQGLGYDVGGTFSTTAPTGTTVDLWLSPYNSSRATAAIFNWNGTATVSLDVSGLGVTEGQTVTLRNVADYYTDTSTTTVSSGHVTVPMTGHTIARPNGWGVALGSSTFPTFGTFVLEFGAAAPLSTKPVTLRGGGRVRRGVVR